MEENASAGSEVRVAVNPVARGGGGGCLWGAGHILLLVLSTGRVAVSTLGTRMKLDLTRVLSYPYIRLYSESSE